MSKGTMTQCRLRNGISEVVTWIESYAAVIGKTMTLEDLEGRWEVVYVGDTMSAESLQKQASFYRTHRKGTDI
jgi:hypothetical protein